LDFHPRLIHHLDTLTEGLRDGSDLHAILAVLVDDLTEAVPSFLGLDLILTTAADALVTVSTMDHSRARQVRASLLLPLGLMGVGYPGTTVVYYAATPGEFTDLAAATHARYELDGNVVLDEHLTPAAAPGITGLDELDTINQAIGVLIWQGHTPDEARAALQRIATRGKLTLLEAAARLLRRISP
jgi:hypothetical protein